MARSRRPVGRVRQMGRSCTTSDSHTRVSPDIPPPPRGIAFCRDDDMRNVAPPREMSAAEKLIVQ
jgi:hypothetical protein